MLKDSIVNHLNGLKVYKTFLFFFSRFNDSLTNLSQLIPKHLFKKGQNISKTDILDVASGYIRSLQEAEADQAYAKPSTDRNGFEFGFRKCSEEVMNLLFNVIDPHVYKRLHAHLQKCLDTIEGLAPIQNAFPNSDPVFPQQGEPAFPQQGEQAFPQQGEPAFPQNETSPEGVIEIQPMLDSWPKNNPSASQTSPSHDHRPASPVFNDQDENNNPEDPNDQNKRFQNTLSLIDK